MITQPGSTLPFAQVHATDSGLNDIPAMTDPMGKHWRQPADIRYAPMDATHVVLRQDQIDKLSVYDSSYPSGTYDGKCWLRNGEEDDQDVQWLVWYEPHKQPGKIGISWRTILLG